MSQYKTNDGRYPDDSTVWTPYPLTDDSPPYDEWPWLQGTVLGQCGPNEWHIVIEAPEVIELVGDSAEWHPACFRNGGELRPVITHIGNNRRFPAGLKVWTPYPDPDAMELIQWAEPGARGYVSPQWPWVQGHILDQVSDQQWLVLIDSYDPPMVCVRTATDLRPMEATR